MPPQEPALMHPLQTFTNLADALNEFSVASLAVLVVFIVISFFPVRYGKEILYFVALVYSAFWTFNACLLGGLAVYQFWGSTMLFVSLLLAGVGTVPFGIVAALTHGFYRPAIVILLYAVGAIVALRVTRKMRSEYSIIR